MWSELRTMFAALSRFAQALQENAFPKESKLQVLVVLFESINISSSTGSWNCIRNHHSGWSIHLISIPHLWKRNWEHRLLPAFPNWTPSVPPRRVTKSARYMREADADPFRMGFVWGCWVCWVVLCHHLSGMEPPAALSYMGTGSLPLT